MKSVLSWSGDRSDTAHAIISLNTSGMKKQVVE